MFDKFHVLQHANAAVDVGEASGVLPQGRPVAQGAEREALAAAEPGGTNLDGSKQQL